MRFRDEIIAGEMVSDSAGIEPAPSFRVSGYTAQIPNTHPDFSVWLNDLFQNIPAFYVAFVP
jgi:hypothetical protein